MASPFDFGALLQSFMPMLMMILFLVIFMQVFKSLKF